MGCLVGGGSAPASPLGQGAAWGAPHSQLLGALVPRVFQQCPVPYLAHQPAARGPACTTGPRAVFKCNIACVFYCVCVYIYVCVCVLEERSSVRRGPALSLLAHGCRGGRRGSLWVSPCPACVKGCSQGFIAAEEPCGWGPCSSLAPGAAGDCRRCWTPPVRECLSACCGSTPSPWSPAGGLCWLLWAPCQP